MFQNIVSSCVYDESGDEFSFLISFLIASSFGDVEENVPSSQQISPHICKPEEV